MDENEGLSRDECARCKVRRQAQVQVQVQVRVQGAGGWVGGGRAGRRAKRRKAVRVDGGRQGQERALEEHNAYRKHAHGGPQGGNGQRTVRRGCHAKKDVFRC